MKKASATYFLIIIAVVFFLFSSCKWGTKRSAPKGKNIICLVDFSNCKNVAERLQFYRDVIKQTIIPKLGLYDKIVVMPIDKASITNASDILLKDLSAVNFAPDQSSPMEEEQLTLNNLKKYKDTLGVLFTQSFQAAIDSRNKTSDGTDIFGALGVAVGKLRPGDDNDIIILSDMMNWSSILNMEPANSGFNRETLDGILNKVPGYYLANATILVLTAEQVEVTPEHFSLVKDFWTKYFQKGQAKLYDYNSASVSKLDELMDLHPQ